MQQSNRPVVIIECCINCKYHIWCSQHSEWKYIQHFNELKKKIQKYLKPCIVVRNPIPDNLIKLDDPTGQENKYYDTQTQEAVIFPRLGAFQIYIFNLLIFSKLQFNKWPNHQKIVNLLARIIDDESKGFDISKYSIDQLIQQQRIYKKQIGRSTTVRGNQSLNKTIQNFEVKKSKLIKNQLIKLPPTNRSTKKVMKITSQQKKSLNNKMKLKKTKAKIKPKLIKFQDQKKNSLVEIEKKNQQDNGMVSVESNFTQDRSNLIKTAQYKFRYKEELTEGNESEKKNAQRMNKTMELKNKQSNEQFIDKSNQIILNKRQKVEIEIQKVQDDNQNRNQQFTKEYKPFRIKDYPNFQSDFVREQKQQVISKFRKKFAQRKLEITPIFTQILNKPKQIIKQQSQHQSPQHQLPLQIQNQPPPQIQPLPSPQIKKKQFQVVKQIEYQINRQIIMQVANKQFNIIKQIQYEINKQIIQQKAKITYHDDAMQVSEKSVSEFSQQMTVKSIPEDLIKEFNNISLQAQQSFRFQNQKVFETKRDISIQMSQFNQQFGQQKIKPIEIKQKTQPKVDQIKQNVQTIKVIKLQIGINTSILNKDQSIEQSQVEIPLVYQTLKDQRFINLYEKRKNIIDNKFYSVGRFQQIETKYKWIARANYLQDQKTTKQIYFKEKVLFTLYNIFGVASINKRLSYQYYTNLLHEQSPEKAYLHYMSEELPQVRYFNDFEQYQYSEQKFPVGDTLTFKQSKNLIKIKQFGKLLALAKFFNDIELFSQDHIHIGFEMKNYEIVKFYKVLNLNYNFQEKSFSKPERSIQVSKGNKFIAFKQLSKNSQIEFINTILQINSINLEEIKNKLKLVEEQEYTFQKTFQRSIDYFINFLSNQRQLLKYQYQLEYKMFAQYKSFGPVVPKFWKTNFFILPYVEYYTQKMRLGQCLSIFLQNQQENNKILLIKGCSGSGKSSSLKYLSKEVEKRKKYSKTIMLDLLEKSNEELNILSKQLAESNILFIDNFQYCDHFIDILKLFNINANNKKLIISCDISNFVQETVNSYFVSIGFEYILQCSILPFTDKQIIQYTANYLKQIEIQKTNEQFTNLTLQMFKLDQVRMYISIPGLLNFAIYFLNQLTQKKQEINIYKLINLACQASIKNHKQFSLCSKLQYKDIQSSLKKFAFKIFKENKYYLTSKEFPIFKSFQLEKHLESALDFYPINYQNSKYSFYHSRFLYFFVSCAICEIVEKGFKGVDLIDITKNKEVIRFIKERYSGKGGQNKLIDIILQSKLNSNLSQQSSNAITLLAKIGYVFSDINFEGVQIPNADLSFSVFYNVSFRFANLSGVKLFNVNAINTNFDAATVSGVDFGMRKYNLESEILCGALSFDGKYIAIGSGNQVLLLNSETGRMIKMFTGHSDLIRNVFFSRDQVSVISISDDKSIKIWNIDSSACITLKVPSKVGIVFNLQAERICCANKQLVRVWSMKLIGGEVVLKGHTGSITSIIFNANGTLIVTTSTDKTAKIWDLNGKNIQTFVGHKSEVNLATISQKNEVLATTGQDNTIRIWDIKQGYQKYVFEYSQKISTICFSPQQKYLVISESKQFLIKVINIKSFQQAFKFQGHQDEVIKLEFDKLGQKLISVSLDKTIRVWNFKKCRETQFIEGHSEQVWCVNFHKNNQFAASGGADKLIKIWDIKNGNLLRTLSGHQNEVFTVCFNPIGTTLASGGEDCTLRIWDSITGEQKSILRYHNDWIYCVVYSNDGSLLASSDSKGLIIVWNVYKQQIKARLQDHISEVYSICFNKSNQILASGGSDKTIKIWNIPNQIQIKTLKAHTDNIWSVKFFREDELLSGSKDGTLIVWNYISGQIIKRLKCNSSVQSICVINNSRICFSLEDGKIKVVDIFLDKQIKVFRSSDSVWNIDLSMDKERIISAGADNSVRMWNLNSINQNRDRFVIKFSNIVYNRKGDKSAKLINSKQIILIDLIHREQSIINLDDQIIVSIAFTYDDNLIIVSDDDSSKEYNLITKQKKRIININDYNKDSSHELLFCKGKLARTFENCSFKKLKHATQQTIDIFDE